MGRLWSREHLVRRIDRYYLLAAAAKIPEIRQWYIGQARYYRRLLAPVVAL
ncbi:MAG TPA: hypothetical protein VF503_32500 [Sphingobium sp.]|uniref:hypothetical protein n=1 Tax=Sphingobium sp. TaxID=1912891 RepID=UPI002ED01928